jgi:hypothetical protein
MPPPSYVPRGTVDVQDWPLLFWVTPTGEELPMSDTEYGWFTPEHPKGLFGPSPMAITTLPRARGGVEVTHHQPGERIVTWPVYVEGSTYTQLVERWERLITAITSTSWLGPGKIRVRRRDGTARETEAYWQDGLDHDTVSAGIRQVVSVMTLLCPSGYWRDLTPTPIIRTGNPVARSFFKRFPRTSSSQALGATKVTNRGDVPAWPIWTLTGPLASVEAINQRRGERWKIDVQAYRGSPLGAGETVTIDSETGAVTGPNGATWAGAIDWTVSDLWPLDKGTTDVTLTVVNAAGGSPKVEGSFYALRETC